MKQERGEFNSELGNKHKLKTQSCRLIVSFFFILRTLSVVEGLSSFFLLPSSFFLLSNYQLDLTTPGKRPS